MQVVIQTMWCDITDSYKNRTYNLSVNDEFKDKILQNKQESWFLDKYIVYGMFATDDSVEVYNRNYKHQHIMMVDDSIVRESY